MKKDGTLSKQFQNPIKIAETERTIDTPNIQIHVFSLSWQHWVHNTHDEDKQSKKHITENEKNEQHGPL